jgi:hypothetical protein
MMLRPPQVGSKVLVGAEPLADLSPTPRRARSSSKEGPALRVRLRNGALAMTLDERPEGQSSMIADCRYGNEQFEKCFDRWLRLKDATVIVVP